MADIARRLVMGGGLAAGAAASLAACSNANGAPRMGHPGPPTPTGSSIAAPTVTKLIGDGSTSDTGPQPHQPTWRTLEPGDTPPQLVVISWDGAGNLKGKMLLARFRGIAKDTGASMTLFLSGLWFLPSRKKSLYHPPNKPVGASAIGYFDDHSVHETIRGIGQAWREGHEIGTHFNGHFCDPKGVGSWTPEQWKDEIAQAKSFVENWKTNTGFTDLPALPFDYEKELVGSRAPCLQGSENLRIAASQLGWRYDSSANGVQMWPKKVRNLWAVDLQSIPFAGHGTRTVLSMDYNLMYNQSKVTQGPASMHATWKQQAIDSYMAGFNRVYESNRAPLIIGNHFETWNAGIYMDAVEEVMHQVSKKPDTHIVSFRQLADYLDLQDPAILARLRTLPFGTKPPGGWSEFLQPLTGAAAAAADKADTLPT